MDYAEADRYLKSLPYIPARDQWCCRQGGTKWIVLHSMEAPEGPNTAENCANYFANPGNRVASTQFCVDEDSTVRCAGLDRRVAGAVGANDLGIHIEQAGFAAQNVNEWNDVASRKMILNQTAYLCAALCRIYNLPATFIDAGGLRAGKPGITTHAECYKAFGGDVRTDPGSNYPMQLLLDQVNLLLNGVTFGDDFMTPDDKKYLEQKFAELNSQLDAVRDQTGTDTPVLRERVNKNRTLLDEVHAKLDKILGKLGI